MRCRRIMPVVTTVVLAVIVMFALGCSTLKRVVHRIDVDQGNYLEQQHLRKLKRGMTKEQVLFLLGTPVVNDPFSERDSWFYLFRQRVAHQAAVQKNLKLTFDAQGRLRTIESDFPTH